MNKIDQVEVHFESMIPCDIVYLGPTTRSATAETLQKDDSPHDSVSEMDPDSAPDRAERELSYGSIETKKHSEHLPIMLNSSTEKSSSSVHITHTSSSAARSADGLVTNGFDDHQAETHSTVPQRSSSATGVTHSEYHE